MRGWHGSRCERLRFPPKIAGIVRGGVWLGGDVVVMAVNRELMGFASTGRNGGSSGGGIVLCREMSMANGTHAGVELCGTRGKCE